jgi:Holliday junction resolvase
LKGNLGKEIVRSLLERSGYTVSLYGYEETMLDAMSKSTFKKSGSITGRRLRSSPDLLVYDDKDVMMLVEVKTRGQSPPIMKAKEINNLKEFWNDSILVLLVPDGNVFYAKKVEEMEREPEDTIAYHQLSDFKEFQDIFTRVHPDDIKHYRRIVLEMLKIFMPEKEKGS